MKISYNWLKWYIPEAPLAEKLADVFTYHVCEVEDVEKREDGDFVFDIKILPNRAHDLLSHYGVAQELSRLLNIKFVDPISKYKIPESKKSNFVIKIESDKCRRYMGRVIRKVKVGPSPEWIVKHLESIGQRSINNMVDAANIVMFNVGQPTHIFDFNKVKEGLFIRQANEGESMTTLDNKECKFRNTDLVIADSKNVLAVAGIKGGKIAEVDNHTKDIILEVANFEPTSVRKTAQHLNIFTDAKKRFENDLSSELGDRAMLELSALIFEMCPNATFEDVVDIYTQKQIENKLSFSTEIVSKILGLEISAETVSEILKRYDFKYTENDGVFEIVIPKMRLDLTISEDMAEEIGRIIGYDKIAPHIPKINFKVKQDETFAQISFAREKLLNDGYSEVITYMFRDKGEVSVLASASDKKFLRTNLSDGLKESIKLNTNNLPFLGIKEVKVFEIGKVFTKKGEGLNIAYGNKKEVKEISIDEFIEKQQENFSTFLQASLGTFRHQNSPTVFHMWSLFPFIARDISVWVPEEVESNEVLKIIKNNTGNMVVRGPELFDEFKKDGKKSYAFRLVFQSYEKTLTDTEVNEVMIQITNKIKDNNGWQVR